MRDTFTISSRQGPRRGGCRWPRRGSPWNSTSCRCPAARSCCTSRHWARGHQTGPAEEIQNLHDLEQFLQFPLNFLVMASSFLNWSFWSWFSKRSTTFNRKVMTALWMNFIGELSVLLSGSIIRPTKINYMNTDEKKKTGGKEGTWICIYKLVWS